MQLPSINKSAPNINALGIYISPKEICIAQTKPDKNGRIRTEHLLKLQTGFQAKEGMLRPLSLNNDFFNEKASWLTSFKSAVKKTGWDTARTIITLSPQFGILRYFVMPFVDRRYRSKSIPIESKKYIPVSFDEVIYDFNAYPLEGGKKLGVLFGVTQRKSVEFLINTLRLAGLELAAVEMNAVSLERMFAYLDPKDHMGKGYIHFSGGSSSMLFSSDGHPVLYRETDFESAGTMSERKRLDIKGAVQFVERYVSGQTYKNLMLSGDGLEAWKSLAAQETAMPITAWEPAKTAGLKDNDAAAFFAVGASIRGRSREAPALDISGISTGLNLDKQVRTYIWNITCVLGGFLLFLSVINQTRLFMISSKISSLTAQVGNISELASNDAGAIKAKIDKIQSNVRMLSTLVADTDSLAPKLQAITEKIPSELWLTNMRYSSPFAASELLSTAKEMTLTGETVLKGEMKIRVVELFHKGLKGAGEFKVFNPPGGGMEFKTEDESIGLPTGFGDRSSRNKATGFSIQCLVKRSR
ncbi:MAG: hypothetical protein HY796_09255 [Elusimicrobia bacterium]|nr:hypothetical protein [Elusimicrobiota bacterium]